ncbi:uncharacterized protein CEXT_30721 [Caerostris extrusa]|uniref:Uncharacterized protein n=1 Tax=Caerostris extrusa TaxID=172846 RepID=A0AAV4R638_CAEEX|nr:uncharacterized protein CEXT_30721 [Caerostris extrusa]
MFCKRKLTTTTLRQLRSIPSSTHQKKINLIAFSCVACRLLFQFQLYLQVIKNTKGNSQSGPHTRSSEYVSTGFWTKPADLYPATQSKGGWCLEQHSESLLRSNIFMFIANLSSCGIVVAWILEYSLKEYQSFMIIGTVFFVINSFSSMTAVLWMAGQVPIQLQKLKESFYEKAHLRLISVCDLDEPQFKKELMEKPDFVLTGCEIISLRRSTVLGVFGTLLTYTVLAVSIKGNGVNERNATCTV